MSSPVVVGEDGAGPVPSGGFEFGIDPNEDPELALVSRTNNIAYHRLSSFDVFFDPFLHLREL